MIANIFQNFDCLNIQTVELFEKYWLTITALKDVALIKNENHFHAAFTFSWARMRPVGNWLIILVFVFKVNYNISVKGEQNMLIDCVCFSEQSAIVPTINPLDVSVRLTSIQFEPIEGVHADEPFLLLSDIRCSSPWPLVIKSSQIELVSFLINHVMQWIKNHDFCCSRTPTYFYLRPAVSQI